MRRRSGRVRSASSRVKMRASATSSSAVGRGPSKHSTSGARGQERGAASAARACAFTFLDVPLAAGRWRTSRPGAPRAGSRAAAAVPAWPPRARGPARYCSPSGRAARRSTAGAAPDAWRPRLGLRCRIPGPRPPPRPDRPGTAPPPSSGTTSRSPPSASRRPPIMKGGKNSGQRAAGAQRVEQRHILTAGAEHHLLAAVEIGGGDRERQR